MEKAVRRLVAALALTCVSLPASAQTVQERLPTCLACHGENGQSQNPDVPSLGAQQSFYVTVQLLMFRERMRLADPMNDMAKGLSDGDLRSFADVIAKLPAPHPPDAPARGRASSTKRRSASSLARSATRGTSGGSNTTCQVAAA